MSKRELKARASKHVEQAWKLAELLLPNASNYDRAALVDRILRLASDYRLLGVER